jgi:hypothetical protein
MGLDDFKAAVPHACLDYVRFPFNQQNQSYVDLHLHIYWS